jgi:hypothetical protein
LQYFALRANFIGQGDEMEAAAFETRVCAVDMKNRRTMKPTLRRSFATYLFIQKLRRRVRLNL